MGIFRKLSGVLPGRAKRDENRHNNEAARAIYLDVVRLARQRSLYTLYGVADDIDGRFDAIALILGLYLRQLRALEGAESRLGRALASVFIADMDRSLREMGVGDLSVGKEIKKMTAALYGRVKAYDEALSNPNRIDGLVEVLARNLYRGAPKVEMAAQKGLAEYIIRLDDALRGMDKVALVRGAAAQDLDLIR